MLRIDVTKDFDQMRSRVAGAEKQVRFAMAQALTKTAQAVKAEQIKEMRDVFDRPTPYTLNSLFLRGARRDRLEAVVWLKDEGGEGTPATRYLAPQIRGGPRPLKKFELALRQAGLLPDGMIAVPGTGARMDRYGNMSRGQIVQILAYFRTFGEVGFKANIDEKGRRRLARGTKSRQGFAYFVGRPADGKLPFGVWQRVHFAVGSAIKPILLFVDQAHYEAIYDFDFVAKLTVQRELRGQFAQSLKSALATAR